VTRKLLIVPMFNTFTLGSAASKHYLQRFDSLDTLFKA
jgi:hypothetical protein